jgi:hypothetical protein
VYELNVKCATNAVKNSWQDMIDPDILYDLLCLKQFL